MSLNLSLGFSEFNLAMDKPSVQTIYEFGGFRLDAGHLMLYRNDEEVPLAPKAVETLLALIERRGEIVSKEELFETVWPDAFVEESNLFHYLHILRKTLGDQKDGKPYVETYRRRGYRFNGDARIVRQELANEHYAWVVDNPDQDAGNIETQSGRLYILKDLNDDKSESDDVGPESLALPTDSSGENLPDTNTPANEGTRNKFRYVFSFSLGVILLTAIFAASFYWRSRQGTAADPPKSIAILPFKPLVADNREEFLELGMADTLIARLGKNRSIIVRPISSVRAFNKPDQDPISAGKTLGVDSVLDGSLQRVGDNIRVNVRLLKVADGTTIWADTFDENFNDILVVQDAISNRIAAALALRLGGGEKMQLTKRFTENVEAYQLYSRGRFHAAKLIASEMKKGVSYFQQAIEIDPSYALAYVGLAEAWRGLATAGQMPPAELFQKAKAAAQKAVEIDEGLADGHAILGFIIFFYDWDWNAAEVQYLRALELDPNSADTHRYYAHLLSNTGRHAEALAEIQRARELDPLDLRTNALEGQFLLHAGQTDKALARLQKTFELDPNFWLAHLFASSAYIEKGMFPEAVAEALKAKEFSGPNTHPLAFESYALASSGKQTEARDVLAELLKSSTTRVVSSYHVALTYNGLGDRDETLIWLERAFEQRDPMMVFLQVEPKWNNLRSEPRFISLMKKMNFEQ